MTQALVSQLLLQSHAANAPQKAHNYQKPKDRDGSPELIPVKRTLHLSKHPHPCHNLLLSKEVCPQEKETQLHLQEHLSNSYGPWGKVSCQSKQAKMTKAQSEA